MTGISAGKTWSRIGPEVAPTSAVASGVWTLQEYSENQGAGTWPNPTGDWDLIADIQNSTASLTKFEFTGIPQDYKHLQMVIIGTGSGSGDNMYLDINNNSGNFSLGGAALWGGNYAGGAGASGFPLWELNSQSNLSSSTPTGVIGSTSNASNDPPVWTWNFPAYSSTSVYKTIDCQFNGANYGTAFSANKFGATRLAQQWRQTTAITSLQITMVGGWRSVASGVTGKYNQSAQLYGSK